MKPAKSKVSIVGAGLAGAEAACYLLRHGIAVDLYERRPRYPSPAHQTDLFAELVCSNSLKSQDPDSAPGLLKEELRELGSITMEAAKECVVPGGASLCVDRLAFARKITAKIRSFSDLKVFHEEVSEPPEGLVILATGPLTGEGLLKWFETFLGRSSLSFFDASAPIIAGASIDRTIVYEKARYDKGSGGYLNCPFTKKEYDLFLRELLAAKVAHVHSFDTAYFEGCLPLEVLARRGPDALRYGPMKPIGLSRPDGSRPYAVVQLRQEDLLGDAYGLVGFQTNLTYPEQERVFSLIPGLAKAHYLRHGLMHRNTYLASPAVLTESLALKKKSSVFIAGQLAGVEGYVESAALGLLVGIFVHRLLMGKKIILPPLGTMIGALTHYVTHADPQHFSPMNANFALFQGMRKDNHHAKVEEALQALRQWKAELDD